MLNPIPSHVFASHAFVGHWEVEMGGMCPQPYVKELHSKFLIVTLSNIKSWVYPKNMFQGRYIMDWNILDTCNSCTFVLPNGSDIREFQSAVLKKL
jgi:hypothetical protein